MAIWDSRPVPTTDKDREDMRYGFHRGKKLCDCCCENYATTWDDLDGDPLCNSCYRWLQRQRQGK